MAAVDALDFELAARIKNTLHADYQERKKRRERVRERKRGYRYLTYLETRLCTQTTRREREREKERARGCRYLTYLETLTYRLHGTYLETLHEGYQAGYYAYN